MPGIPLLTTDEARAAGIINLKARIRERLHGSTPSRSVEEWRLLGLTAADTQQFRPFFPQEPVPAAVLVPIVDRPSGLTVLLTQRASHLKNHAGQISFPGGRIEPSDAGPAAAALREAQEEIGLASSLIELVGFLPDHVIVSGYRVTPVVGFVRPEFELTVDHGEVLEAFEVPLAHIFDPANRKPRIRHFGERAVEFLDIPYGEREIWGATAGMLLTFHRLVAGEDR